MERLSQKALGINCRTALVTLGGTSLLAFIAAGGVLYYQVEPRQFNLGTLLFLVSIGVMSLLILFARAVWQLQREVALRLKDSDQLEMGLQVFHHSFNAIVVADSQLTIAGVNPAYTKITGYASDELVGVAFDASLTAQSRAAIQGALQTWAADGHAQGIEIQGYRKNGELYDALLSLSSVHDDSGNLVHVVAVFTETTQLKEHERQLERASYYEPLSGLPNQLLMLRHVEQAIVQHRDRSTGFALCMLDIDNFQSINDEYSQEVGDEVLLIVADRLRQQLSAEDRIGHLGGDKFLLLLSDLADADGCYSKLDAIMAQVRTRIAVAGFSLNISASIGVTVFPHDASNAHRLMRHAHIALNQAKEQGKGRVNVFDIENELSSQHRRDMLTRLRQALEHNEFVLFFQPKVDMLEQRVVGAEALIRWQHPERGLVPPAEFLPVLESSDLEIEVGEWVIDAALRQMQHWLRAHELCIPVSVNISAHHLLRSDFTERLKLALARYPDITEHSLELEIVETTALSDFDTAIGTLRQCSEIGVNCALDDFGTGYSSLAYFQKLPVSVLKIDQTFVRNMHESAADLRIVESVVKLAQVFNRAVIAEGVETEAHIELLQRIGCRYGQGYGIAKPMPAAHLLDWVRSWEQSGRRKRA